MSTINRNRSVNNRPTLNARRRPSTTCRWDRATQGDDIEYVVTNPNDGTRDEISARRALAILVKGKDRYFEPAVEYAAVQ